MGIFKSVDVNFGSGFGIDKSELNMDRRREEGTGSLAERSAAFAAVEYWAEEKEKEEYQYRVDGDESGDDWGEEG